MVCFRTALAGFRATTRGALSILFKSFFNIPSIVKGGEIDGRCVPEIFFCSFLLFTLS